MCWVWEEVGCDHLNSVGRARKKKHKVTKKGINKQVVVRFALELNLYLRLRVPEHL